MTVIPGHLAVHARKPAISPGDNRSDAGIASQAPRASGRAEPIYKSLFEGAGRLIEAGDEAALLAQLCQTLAGSGLFISAAVGRMDRQKIWRHHGAASCRDAAGFRAAITSYRPGEPGPPLCLLAWSARKSLIANHYTTDPRFARYREAARHLGVGAIAAIVIRRHRRRWAVLSVSAADKNFFDAEIISLLERLARIAGRRLDEFDCKTALAAERAAQSRATRRNALTALPNAIALAEELPKILGHAQQRAAATAIARLDIENLDGIFLHWGFAAGEAVVRAFAMRLRDCLRRPDFLAHCGGEKFAIVFEATSGAASAAAFAARLQKTLSAPVALPGGQSLHVPHILGVTLCPRDGSQPAALLEQAETALHLAKTANAGGENWRLFEPAAPGQNAPGPVLARLAQDGLRLHYQPVLELTSGRIIAVEALARLDDAGHLSLPEEFLPGLLMDGKLALFRQVLRTALAQLAAWDRDGIKLNLSVNIDAPVLLLDDTLAEVRAALAAAGIAPYRLVLEILETHDFLDLSLAREKIAAFRRAGIRLALDDLGAGHASLLKIRELPLDMVKLDRAFIAGLRNQPDDLLFVTALQTLTATRDITLVVEGVESEDVLDALRMLGVRQVQGFLIARPMPAHALSAWLPAQTPAKSAVQPQTLLGAYAVHLAWLRAYNTSRSREGSLGAMDSDAAYSLVGFFAARPFHSLLTKAYQKMYIRMTEPSPARGLILEAAQDFRLQLTVALRAEG
jgi:diguanylate cyclase (GGDEF)-like protein